MNNLFIKGSEFKISEGGMKYTIRDIELNIAIICWYDDIFDRNRQRKYYIGTINKNIEKGIWKLTLKSKRKIKLSKINLL